MDREYEREVTKDLLKQFVLFSAVTIQDGVPSDFADDVVDVLDIPDEVFQELYDEGMLAEPRRGAQATEAGRDYLHALRARDLDRVRETSCFGPDTEALVLELKFDFTHTGLLITRTLEVPRKASFDELHAMILATFNWHRIADYDITLERDGMTLLISDPGEGGEGPLEEFMLADEGVGSFDATTTIVDELVTVGTRMVYTYDYEDEWRIIVTCTGETVLADGFPRCTDGRGPSPVEGTGGELGFRDFQTIVEDDRYPEHDDYVRWARREAYGPFDLEATNEHLATWARLIYDEYVQGMRATELVRAHETDEGPLSDEMVQAIFREVHDQRVLEEATLADNEDHIATFERTLTMAGLRRETIDKHLSNITAYLNDFLASYKGASMQEGLDPDLVDEFMGAWVLDEILHTSRSSYKSFATSIKKFYAAMASAGLVDRADVRDLTRLVSAQMPTWLDAYEQSQDDLLDRLLNSFRASFGYPFEGPAPDPSLPGDPREATATAPGLPFDVHAGGRDPDEPTDAAADDAVLGPHRGLRLV